MELDKTGISMTWVVKISWASRMIGTHFLSNSLSAIDASHVFRANALQRFFAMIFPVYNQRALAWHAVAATIETVSASECDDVARTLRNPA
jgi:hypothetical protein